MSVLILSFAFAFGFLARWLGLPPLAGFLIAGFVLHAVGVPSHDAVRLAADVGVTLLMFTIGLKLNLQTLARPIVWAGTTVHALASTAIAAAVVLAAGAAGFSPLTGLDLGGAVLVGFALSFSSTVFAVKVLEQSGDSSATYGKIAIGVLIMQDVLAVVFLAFSSGLVPSPLAFALLLLVPARPALHRLAAASGHGELLVVGGLFLALIVGYASFDFTGMKGDLGALAVGVLIGGHPKSKELADALYGLKEILLVGFFLHIGLSGSFSSLSIACAGLLLLLVPIKSLLYFLVFTRFGLRARGSTLATLSLTSFSEFGLIVVKVGVEKGWLAEHWLVTIALALTASLVLASPLNARAVAYRTYERLAPHLRRFEKPAALPRSGSIDLNEIDVLVFGMGRVGTGAYDALAGRLGPRVLGVDHDSESVLKHRETGRNVVPGDAIDHELWDELQNRLDRLHLVVLTLHDHAANLQVLRLLREHDYHGLVAAVAKFADQLQQLEASGAQVVFNFYDRAGAGLAERAFEALEALEGREERM